MFKALYAELGKLPSVIGDDNLGPMVDNMIRKYWDAVNARHDLSVYKKMQEVAKELRGYQQVCGKTCSICGGTDKAARQRL